MIRAFTEKDAPRILDIWLSASLQAHDFVPKEYWQGMLKSVARDYLPDSRTFVFEDKHQIKGFISIVDDNHIGALFVAPEYQNRRIGFKLLRYVKRRCGHLSLNVFAQNEQALRFYQRCDFKIIREQTEPSTQKKELIMAWAMGCKSGFFKRHQGDS